MAAAFAADFGLDRDTALRLSQPFGGGIARRADWCGALTGAFLVIGLKHGRVRAEDAAARDRTYALVQDFIARFTARHGEIKCRDLLGCDIGTPEGQKKAEELKLHQTKCEDLVRDAARHPRRDPLSPMSVSLAGLKVFVRTFGCQMNENDSEHIAGILVRAGAARAEGPEDADIVVVNTCAVRQKSEEKLYSYLGRLSRLKKKRRFLLGVAGCVAQVRRADLLGKRPYIDFVAGPDSYLDLPEIVGRAAEAPVVRTEFGRDWKEVGAASTVRQSAWSAFVPVMEGCDNFCAYCIVPFTPRPGEIPAAARASSKRSGRRGGGGRRSSCSARTSIPTGTRRPGPGSPACSRRSRPFPGSSGSASSPPTRRTSATTSSGPWPAHPKVCPALHLPLQSGSSRVLERMNRGYTREEYLALVGRLRRSLPELLLMTDIIVGFPGETEEDFEATCGLLGEVRFAGIFSFRYSPRPLTAAAAGPDDVPLEVKRRRLIALQALQKIDPDRDLPVLRRPGPPRSRHRPEPQGGRTLLRPHRRQSGRQLRCPRRLRPAASSPSASPAPAPTACTGRLWALNRDSPLRERSLQRAGSRAALHFGVNSDIICRLEPPNAGIKNSG